MSKTNLDNLGKTPENILALENLSEGLFIQKAKLWLKVIRIFTIILLLLLVFVAIFIPNISLFVTVPMTVLAFLSVIIGRSIAFYYKQLTLIGFVTEMCCIFGIVFIVVGAFTESGFMMISGVFFSFAVAPLLGIVNRSISLVHQKSKKRYAIIAEIAILSMSAIIATWFLLKAVLESP